MKCQQTRQTEGGNGGRKSGGDKGGEEVREERAEREGICKRNDCLLGPGSKRSLWNLLRISIELYNKSYYISFFF